MDNALTQASKRLRRAALEYDMLLDEDEPDARALLFAVHTLAQAQADYLNTLRNMGKIAVVLDEDDVHTLLEISDPRLTEILSKHGVGFRTQASL